MTERQSDVRRMLDLRIALGLTDDRILFTTIPGAPWSKMRPRHGKNGRTYSAHEDVDAEERSGGYLRLASQGKTFDGNVGLACVFFRPNLLKHVCDAANGVLWKDDSQVTAILGITELDSEQPRTLVMVAPHVSTLMRGTDAVIECTVCGAEMPIVSHARKTCSRACTQRLRGYPQLGDTVPCAFCGKPFKRVSSYRKLCSPECRADSLRGRNKGRRRPLSECLTCGKQLTHHRGGQCRECWRESRTAQRIGRPATTGPSAEQPALELT